MSDDIWSKQFYKALEAVGNLTEQEKLRLGEMLVSLHGVKTKYDFDSETALPARITTEFGFSDIPPPPKPPENRKAGMF